MSIAAAAVVEINVSVKSRARIRTDYNSDRQLTEMTVGGDLAFVAYLTVDQLSDVVIAAQAALDLAIADPSAIGWDTYHENIIKAEARVANSRLDYLLSYEVAK